MPNHVIGAKVKPNSNWEQNLRIKIKLKAE